MGTNDLLLRISQFSVLIKFLLYITSNSRFYKTPNSITEYEVRWKQYYTAKEQEMGFLLVRARQRTREITNGFITAATNRKNAIIVIIVIMMLIS